MKNKTEERVIVYKWRMELLEEEAEVQEGQEEGEAVGRGSGEDRAEVERRTGEGRVEVEEWHRNCRIGSCWRGWRTVNRRNWSFMRRK